MGFLDRFTAKKPAPGPADPVNAPVETTPPASAPRPAIAGGVLPQLAAARALLEAHDLPGATAIHDAVLASAGDRPDVLLTISANLGTHGHVRELIELLAPRYDAELHGPGPGVNLLQAYLAVRQPEQAQHILDLLFSLGRPELEDRLVGFSRAIAEISVSAHAAPDLGAEETTISLVSISKPIWFYGLEEFAATLLPRQTGKLRRVAFAQCALLGEDNVMERATQPEDELGRFTRGLPLWFAESFSSGAGYEPVAGVGVFAPKHYALFPSEWTPDNLRELNQSVQGGLDYVVTAALRNRNADYELTLRIWEVKKFRELKSFSTRWTPVDANAVLAKFHLHFRTYMEWKALPAGNGLPYEAPAVPVSYIQALGGSLSLFFGEKDLLPSAHQPTSAGLFLQAAQDNPTDVRAQLALVTALLRLKQRGLTPDAVALQHVQAWLASEAAQTAGVSGLAARFA
ncbi:MAG: hypothetical protein Q8J74_01990 [Candidatus Didemnitutus sp.]|nr:hypothetical protein [Candidatus Didemnitutus sp.]